MAAEGIEDLTSGNEKPKRAKQWPQKKKFCRLSADNDPGALVAPSAGEKEDSGPGSGAPHVARERELGRNPAHALGVPGAKTSSGIDQESAAGAQTETGR
jgi:hypothetical protein